MRRVSPVDAGPGGRGRGPAGRRARPERRVARSHPRDARHSGAERRIWYIILTNRATVLEWLHSRMTSIRSALARTEIIVFSDCHTKHPDRISASKHTSSCVYSLQEKRPMEARTRAHLITAAGRLTLAQLAVLWSAHAMGVGLALALRGPLVSPAHGNVLDASRAFSRSDAANGDGRGRRHERGRTRQAEHSDGDDGTIQHFYVGVTSVSWQGRDGRRRGERRGRAP